MLSFFIFGTIIGSFLNVVIFRLEKEESFVKGRSHCPKCRKSISWFDNIPIISFLLLKGRCRYCSKKISLQYPLVEVLMGILSVLIFNRFFSAFNNFSAFYQNNSYSGKLFEMFFVTDLNFYTFYNLFSFVLYLGVATVLLGIFIFDLKYYLIPDQFLISGSIFIILIILLEVFSLRGFLNEIQFEWRFLVELNQEDILLLLFTRIGELKLLSSVLGALIASGFFYSLSFISKRKWIGWGDVKFGLLMGLILGFPKVLLGLLVAYLLGAIIGMSLIFFNKKRMGSAIPFGPFLCLATFCVWFFGDFLMQRIF